MQNLFFNILINPAYNFQRDEYLHLDQANHLAWGDISVPPVTSWISYLIKLLGNGFFWIKFFLPLFGALTIVIVWKITAELKGNLFAQVLAALAVLVSAILRINILFLLNFFGKDYVCQFSDLSKWEYLIINNEDLSKRYLQQLPQ